MFRLRETRVWGLGAVYVVHLGTCIRAITCMTFSHCQRCKVSRFQALRPLLGFTGICIVGAAVGAEQCFITGGYHPI